MVGVHPDKNLEIGILIGNFRQDLLELFSLLTEQRSPRSEVRAHKKLFLGKKVVCFFVNVQSFCVFLFEFGVGALCKVVRVVDDDGGVVAFD